MKWIFPAPFTLFVRLSIRHDRFPEFKAGASKVAAAFHQHASARPWAAYSTVAGPGMYAYVMIPMNDLAEMDEIQSVDKVVHDIYGEQGLKELEQLRLSLTDMKTFLLNRLGGAIEGIALDDKPPAYLYYASIKLRHVSVKRFIDAAKGALAVQRQEGSPWFAYGTFAGEQRVHGFAPGANISELGAISSMEETITRQRGSDQAEQLLSDINHSIEVTKTSILRYLGHYNG